MVEIPFYLSVSKDQHAVAIGEEAVALFDGVAVRGEREFGAREGADQQQQAGARQMEVGQHRAHSLKLVAGIDEQIGRPAGTAIAQRIR